ncbi:hypothetical protein A3B42_04935 [Candidatus Daviesbacteria bacterium RIFCSPLOWO2_01_FULL_38_10]|uniref:Uncharacterized protein n=1 Tax=Candidatus Daviesbacteria bacterium GW2011_GWF2_38_6 TaxID=1618432 RepID=A0A0G0KGJ0_9BACT|nr:MAG: hypothetical protein US80_C0004G0016 [Candidatus Daviesbacteria bacterium GW2011_GWA2_38_17]KKQ78753.1 MAG: hypothetical protein US99_C0012G0010 [Candidatus Daviesbacteria bacterium GW2011_GWF2_38_6]OGE27458.1 MAG: hypothetical protein A3D02_03600 [Candidatus Daviesbacteria bacterium RIFCSPHIGHO2_02_FULL_39_41]OGE29664.1 MAG: hypothetical protein A2772_01880 [Candidatus Daviesbacteria bacterium RIFCSPHIGHO2_01_FULL_38_8b]OGE39284.1 MAG: hypothetical protein A3B42_04935 [Candidatus Davie
MSERPKAIVIHPPKGSPKAIIIDPPLSRGRVVGTVPSEPQKFCDWARQFLGVDNQYGFYYEDIAKVAEHLGYHPSAYLWDHYHWMLLLSKGEQGFRIYDSTSGVREAPFTGTQKVHLIGGQGNRFIFTMHFDGWRKLDERGYSLPEEPVSRLGRLLHTPADCGPLSIYAAGVSLGKILLT